MRRRRKRMEMLTEGRACAHSPGALLGNTEVEQADLAWDTLAAGKQ
jgi:hypothetical protein